VRLKVDPSDHIDLVRFDENVSISDRVLPSKRFSHAVCDVSMGSSVGLNESPEIYSPVDIPEFTSLMDLLEQDSDSLLQRSLVPRLILENIRRSCRSSDLARLFNQLVLLIGRE